jgi:hypothetical protein
MYTITKAGIAPLLATAALVFWLTGCSATTEAPPTAFTSDSNPELAAHNDGTTPFQRTYWDRNYDSKAYDELLVAPVNTNYLAAQNFWEKANIANAVPGKAQQDIADIAEYTRQSFIRAAANDPNHRFKVVSEAGPKTLILEVALVQLVPSKVALNAIGYVTWVASAVSYGGSVAGDSQDTGKGVVAIEGRVRDGATGKIIGMFADRERPPAAIVDVKSLNWWAPAKAIIDNWSKQLIEVANRPAGGVTKESKSFELLVW